MIEKGFQTQHVAMATKNLCVCLLLMLNHKCGKFYLILVCIGVPGLTFDCNSLKLFTSYIIIGIFQK